jgi:hypothetical protein
MNPFFTPLVVECVALAVAVVTSIVEYLSSKQLKDAVVYGFLVGGMTFCVCALLQIRYFDLGRIETAVGFSNTLRESGESFKTMQSLNQAAEKVKLSDNEVMQRNFETFLTPLRLTLDEYGQGNFTVPSSEMADYAPLLIKTAKAEVFATSAVTPDKWWGTPMGRAYALANYDAVKAHNLKITRVFLVKDDQELKTLLPLIQAHLSHGISACYLYKRTLDQDADRDLVSVDDKIAGELVLRGNEGFQEARFYFNETKARAFKQYIMRLQRDGGCRQP